MIRFDEAKKSLSEAQEDYLKQIFLLTERGEPAGTQALAEKLCVAPASVTVMLQKLKELELVSYEQYKGVSLSESGRKVALEILRHHRLLESFLQRALGYGWEEVHEEAEKLEHYISETFETRIANWLGHPSFDPHGDPIPDETLALPTSKPSISLADLPVPFRGTIVRVATQDKDELNLLRHLGLVPGAFLELIETTAGGCRFKIEGHQFLLPASLTGKLFFEKES